MQPKVHQILKRYQDQLTYVWMYNSLETKKFNTDQTAFNSLYNTNRLEQDMYKYAIHLQQV